MVPYYEVLRPASKNELDEAGRDIIPALELLPAAGYIEAGRLAAAAGDLHAAERAAEWACSRGIIQGAKPGCRILELESARFWLGQLGTSRLRNAGGTSRRRRGGGTRQTYAGELEAFSRWLPKAEFPAGREAGGAFSDVEDLLRYCEANGAQAARRAVRQHVAELAGAGYSASTARLRCAAVKSYFAAYDVAVDVKVDRRRHDNGGGGAMIDSGMTLMDFYKVMTAGGMDVTARAAMMAKFQAGLDSSTLADRFNFEAYPQMAKHFGTEDRSSWDLDRCPVPIRLVRVKTGMPYTTFIDRDAVTHLRDCLAWKEHTCGKKHVADEPLFVTRRGAPVSPVWVSSKFSRAAANAGVQRKLNPHTYMMRSHEVRDLLKSTLLASGCAAYAADHVLGHAPRDSYEKQAVLYPETLRAEYGKASWRINVFSGFERYLDSVAALPEPGNKAAAHGRDGLPGGGFPAPRGGTQEMQDAFRKMAADMADMFRLVMAGGGANAPDKTARGPRDARGDGHGDDATA